MAIPMEYALLACCLFACCGTCSTSVFGGRCHPAALPMAAVERATHDFAALPLRKAVKFRAAVGHFGWQLGSDRPEN